MASRFQPAGCGGDPVPTNAVDCPLRLAYENSSFKKHHIYAIHGKKHFINEVSLK
jgi:hypothetical protein